MCVSEGDIIADVMTDKANVEVPAPVSGTVLRTSGEPGDLIAVGAELAAFTTSADAANIPEPGGNGAEEAVPTTPEQTPTPEPTAAATERRTANLNLLPQQLRNQPPAQPDAKPVDSAASGQLTQSRQLLRADAVKSSPLRQSAGGPKKPASI